MDIQHCMDDLPQPLAEAVVAIDTDPMNPFAAELQRLGAVVVIGNAMDMLILRKCQVIFAKEIFICTSDDKANVAVAKNVERLIRPLLSAGC